jgi:quinol monooxygenase YgiN
VPDAVITAIGIARAKPGQEEELGLRMAALIAPTRTEAGCIAQDLYRSIDDPSVWMLLEQWRSHRISTITSAASTCRLFCAARTRCFRGCPKVIDSIRCSRQRGPDPGSLRLLGTGAQRAHLTRITPRLHHRWSYTGRRQYDRQRPSKVALRAPFASPLEGCTRAPADSSVLRRRVDVCTLHFRARSINHRPIVDGARSAYSAFTMLVARVKWISGLITAWRELAPYAAIALLPGGTLIVASLWILQLRPWFFGRVRRGLAILLALLPTVALPGSTLIPASAGTCTPPYGRLRSYHEKID